LQKKKREKKKNLYTLGKIAFVRGKEKHAEKRRQKKEKKIEAENRLGKEKKKATSGDTSYHTEGMANANILDLRGCTRGPLSVRIVKPGDESYDAIEADKSTIPCGVAGEAEEVGDVEVEEAHEEGVSGVAGGVLYAVIPPLPGGGGCNGLGGDG